MDQEESGLENLEEIRNRKEDLENGVMDGRILIKTIQKGNKEIKAYLMTVMDNKGKIPLHEMPGILHHIKDVTERFSAKAKILGELENVLNGLNDLEDILDRESNESNGNSPFIHIRNRYFEIGFDLVPLQFITFGCLFDIRWGEECTCCIWHPFQVVIVINLLVLHIQLEFKIIRSVKNAIMTHLKLSREMLTGDDLDLNL